MMVQLLGVFAEFERELIVERTKMGLARKAEKGEWTGGKAPYDYRYDLEARTLVPQEDEAAVVLAMFEKYVLNGMGSVAVANWLNDAGELTRNGSYWTPTRVIAVLRNPTYVGALPFNGQVFDSIHEPIVEPDMFEKAGELLEQRAENRGKRRSNSSHYVLTGFLRCDKCGHGFIGTVAHGRNKPYRYYTCFSRERHGTARCDQDRLLADRLEELVIESAIADLNDGSLFETAVQQGIKEWQESNSGRVLELTRLRRKIDAKRSGIDRLLKAFESGRLSEATCGYRVAELEKELAILESKQAMNNSSEPARDLPSNLLKEIVGGIEKAVITGTPQEVKGFLASFVDSIAVESRRFVQPYFSVVGVRTPFPSRRRTGIEPASELSPAHWF
jgi:site-specific DNA recombinase